MEQIKKTCFVCKKKKALSEFYKHPEMLDGTVNKCKECNKKENKENWWKHRDEKREYDTKRHRHSIQRILSHRYAGIKRRCEIGGNNGRRYKVTGKEYLSKAQFMEWCYSEDVYKKFISLYEDWVKSGFLEKKSPSIDRINSKKSYILGNLQWLTKSDNCKKSNK